MSSIIYLVLVKIKMAFGSRGLLIKSVTRLLDLNSTQRASTDAGDKHLNVFIYTTRRCKTTFFTYFITPIYLQFL